MTQIIDGKKMANEILSDLKSQIKDLPSKPKLAVVLVGRNPASVSYTNIKKKRAEEVGIDVEIHKYSVPISADRLKSEIKAFNNDPGVSGILIQLPLPDSLATQEILDAVSPDKDVDCLTTVNKNKLYKGQKTFFPPAAAAVLAILDFHKVDLKNLNVLIVGSGDLIGKPLSSIFLHRKVAFKLANRHTENLAELARNADVIISGVGKAGLIKGDMVKDGAVVIDAGTAGSDTGEISGDVDFVSVSKKASLITPVPGGVGPVTVAQLLSNTVAATEK